MRPGSEVWGDERLENPTVELLKMTNLVETIEKQLEKLPADQLKQFRSWYEEFDARNWDEQIDHDLASGKLDSLAKAAISDHKAGRTKAL